MSKHLGLRVPDEMVPRLDELARRFGTRHGVALRAIEIGVAVLEKHGGEAWDRHAEIEVEVKPKAPPPTARKR